jgi:hypothetical protein
MFELIPPFLRWFYDGFGDAFWHWKFLGYTTTLLSETFFLCWHYLIICMMIVEGVGMGPGERGGMGKKLAHLSRFLYDVYAYRCVL